MAGMSGRSCWRSWRCWTGPEPMPVTWYRPNGTQLAPIAGGLEERLRSAEGPARTVMLWRRESIWATLRFLDALEA